MSNEKPIIESYLRTHAFPVTSVSFNPSELLLVSGDEGGWCILWSIETRRPLVVWRPHDKAIVTLIWSTSSKLLTHGRDNKLYIFDFGVSPIASSQFSCQLPSRRDSGQEWKKPWMAYSQDVNAMNFCGAALYGNLLAITNTVNSDLVDLYVLPENSEDLYRPYFAISPSQELDDNESALSRQSSTGIVMALLLTPTRLCAGYESGHVAVYDISSRPSISTTNQRPVLLSMMKTHTQPVLSLSRANNCDLFVSTSADPWIVKHDIITGKEQDRLNTHHPGLASTTVRKDGKIVATSGWDGITRVYEFETLAPLAAINTSSSCVAFSGFKVSQVPQVSETPGSGSESGSGPVTLARPRNRTDKLKSTNWLAVGRKDGRVGLITIY